MSTRHRHSDTNASNDNVAATDGRFPDETTPVRTRRFQRPFVDPDEVTQVLVGVRGRRSSGSCDGNVMSS